MMSLLDLIIIFSSIACTHQTTPSIPSELSLLHSSARDINRHRGEERIQFVHRSLQAFCQETNNHYQKCNPPVRPVGGEYSDLTLYFSANHAIHGFVEFESQIKKDEALLRLADWLSEHHFDKCPTEHLFVQLTGQEAFLIFLFAPNDPLQVKANSAVRLSWFIHVASRGLEESDASVFKVAQSVCAVLNKLSREKGINASYRGYTVPSKHLADDNTSIYDKTVFLSSMFPRAAAFYVSPGNPFSRFCFIEGVGNAVKRELHNKIIAWTEDSQSQRLGLSWIHTFHSTGLYFFEKHEEPGRFAWFYLSPPRCGEAASDVVEREQNVELFSLARAAMGLGPNRKLPHPDLFPTADHWFKEVLKLATEIKRQAARLEDECQLLDIHEYSMAFKLSQRIWSRLVSSPELPFLIMLGVIAKNAGAQQPRVRDALAGQISKLALQDMSIKLRSFSPSTIVWAGTGDRIRSISTPLKVSKEELWSWLLAWAIGQPSSILYDSVGVFITFFLEEEREHDPNSNQLGHVKGWLFLLPSSTPSFKKAFVTA